MKHRKRRSVYKYILCCASGQFPLKEDGDEYRKMHITINRHGDPDVESKVLEEDGFDDDENLIKENADAGLDEENLSEDSSGTGISISSDELFQSNDDEPRSPRRPDSILCNFTPDSQNQGYKHDTWKILRCLSEQSDKLDKVLEKLEDNPVLTELRAEVQKFAAKVVEYSRPVSSDDTDSETITSEIEYDLPELESFTNTTVSYMRIASEHDESTTSPMLVSMTMRNSVHMVEEASAMTSDALATRSQRVPREHNDQSVTSTPSSSMYAQIISHQYEEMKRCAKRHSTERGQDTPTEVGELLSQMGTQIVTLQQRQSAIDAEQVARQQAVNWSPRISRLNASVIRTRSFMRASYPSPLVHESIEMKNLQQSEGNSRYLHQTL